jgi:hypothetical protein
MAVLTKRDKLCVLVGVLVFSLFNYPLVHIFNRNTLWAGVPILTWYFFGVWLLAIVGLFFFGRWLGRAQ